MQWRLNAAYKAGENIDGAITLCEGNSAAEKIVSLRHLLNGVFQALAGRELGNLAGRNGDFLAGAGVATLAGGALNHLEAAETGEGHGFARGQGFAQRGHHGVKSFFGFGLGGQAGFGMDLFYELSFGHDATP